MGWVTIKGQHVLIGDASQADTARKAAAGPPHHTNAKKGASHTTVRARSGGEVAKSNKAFYKGGQFLPSTEQPPGTYKFGKTVLSSGNQLIEPGKFATQPTPLHSSIYQIVRGYSKQGPSGLEMMPNLRSPADGSPLLPSTDFRPGVKGIMSTEPATFQQLLDKYNKGERWVTIKLPGK